ncbi:hypothetical protein PUR34_25970 [Streptomyces sp. JV185]|uniref:hypothetical protein n=1 Tax=Streptomyces sp. JV185 TaxID=858638 RepID=UPI002E768B3F|nr:hypothetical protein [Streptomyces sp. JV185]MEE1771502.1 hypothetical protein [Streptomyces sp. JV185]
MGRLRLTSGPEVPDRIVMAQSRSTGEADLFLTTLDASGDTLVEPRPAGRDGHYPFRPRSSR